MTLKQKQHLSSISKGRKQPASVGIYLSKLFKGRIFSNEWKTKISANKCRHDYEVTHPNGTKEIIRNLNTFSDLHNLNRSHMYAISRGTRNIHKGYTVKILKGVSYMPRSKHA